jgi:nicotinamidase-related amidase
MSTKSPDLHGNAPDDSRIVLLLIDVINDLEFEGGDRLLAYALPAAEKIADLKRRATLQGIPAVYVNDNFGKWRSDFKKLISHCLEDGVRGSALAGLLRPGPDDYFVLKPKNSGFFSTSLEILLKHLGAETLILTGLTADNCILFTAGDAHMRDYHLWIPGDCVASEDENENTRALHFMKRVLEADIRPSTELDLKQIKTRSNSSYR